MDPVTIIGLVEGSISLAVQCGSVAKSLNNIAGQYKHAKLALSTMVQNLDIMQIAWDRIAVWSKNHVVTDNDSLMDRLERFLETGFLVLDALEEDLASYDASKMTFRQRSRLVWNEGTLQAHQTRIRDQAQSMSLLLQAIQLPTIQGTAELLQKSQKHFIKSDESAFSIVPSRMSSRFSLSTIQTGDRDSIGSSESLVYRRFSFENDLFTARVYKRNYRTSKYQGSRKQKPDRDVEAVDPRKGDPQSSELADSSELDQELTIRDGNVPTDQEYGDFIEACRKGNKDKINKVLKTASTCGGTEALNIILDCKCDSEHLCPIHATVFGGHLDVMETLRQHAHLKYKSSEDPMALLLCMGREYVMDNGQKQRSVLPLHSATIKGDLSMVRLLLKMGAPINTESVHGVQAIHLAARIGSIEVLAALIAAGASVNCRDNKRRQPMHLAARIGSIETLAALIEADARVNCRDCKGRQPMHYLSEDHRPEIIQYLAENGAEIDGVSGMGQETPLGLACKNRIYANAKALLSLGALVTSQIFDFIFEHGSLDLIETLLISAANQKQGQSIVAAGLRHYLSAFCPTFVRAMRRGHGYGGIRKLKLLLEYTDLQVKNQDGHTVLYDLIHKPSATRQRLLYLAEVFLENLPDFKTLEKDEVRSFVTREEGANSTNQRRSSTDASPILEVLRAREPVKYDHSYTHFLNTNIVSNGKHGIGAPATIENSLGWN